VPRVRFVEIAFTVPAESAESWAEQLVEHGAGGVEERDQGTLERAPAGQVTLVVWIAPEQVEDYLSRFPGAQVQKRERDEDEWRDAWKKYFGVRRVGRFVIVPSWEKHEAQPGDLPIALDPGRAFGTGGHATTRLCLLAVDRWAGRFTGDCRSFLDVGCGSGVLAIGCALRFPEARGAGIDVDADAIEVSRENALRNGVSERIDFSTGKISGQHQIVCANIQPEVLIPMADALTGALAPGGLLVLSGILIEAAEPVERAFSSLRLVSRDEEEGWRALAFTT
jgi:ribosomal protein L11 methyltransferase